MSNGEKEFYMFIWVHIRMSSIRWAFLYMLFNRQNGEMTLVETYSDLPNASFLAVNKDRTVLYAVSETDTYEGRFGGSAAAYAIEARTGRLSKINQQPTDGACSLLY